ncbi:hypothetical protein [Enterovirga aerilata]|uniref:Uncharacterized protein n=1 Tax=Enterovirga aerilata TaxID=2730920 RepID=A0A849HV66_9HYPH|nr:hypothetical protein [Enterovirga sp. DB1703]NNM71002.1 hypothetical protein [Enterovirga sp. DB1703]
MTDQHLADPEEAQAGNPRSRALVPLATPRPPHGSDRPEAYFLAQLIACERRLPAYRQARSAAPETATSAYARRSEPAQARLDCLI